MKRKELIDKIVTVSDCFSDVKIRHLEKLTEKQLKEIYITNTTPPSKDEQGCSSAIIR